MCIVLFPQVSVADKQKNVIDQLEKFEQKNISSLEPWEVAHLFGLTKVRRPSDWTSSKLLSLPVPKRDKQMSCLAEALYFEARGEPIIGQLAVGEVILNRVEDRDIQVRSARLLIKVPDDDLLASLLIPVTES